MNATEFELLGETVYVETDDRGSRLLVTYGQRVIEDSSGDCVQWPYLGHLAGAAYASACSKVLRECGEAACRRALLGDD